jgi:hypothetical protein
MATPDTIEKGLAGLCSIYRKAPLDEVSKKTYIHFLADLPDDLFLAALKHCAATITFFPAVAEIRNAAGHLAKMAQNVPSAEEAWAELLNRAHAPRAVVIPCQHCAETAVQIDRINKELSEAVWARDHERHDALLLEYNEAFRNVRRACPDCQQASRRYEFSHPLIEEVATRLGWPDRFWSNELGVDRGRFIKTYENHVTRLTGEALLLPEVRNYVDKARNDPQLPMFDDDRRAAFETGEQRQISAQIAALTRSMS